MLEQKAVHMTEEEIDAYYAKRHRENLERYYNIQANRAIREDRGRLIRLVLVMIAASVACTVFLQLNFQVQQKIYRVAVLQKEIDALRHSNEDAKNRMEEPPHQKNVPGICISSGKKQNRLGWDIRKQGMWFIIP